MFPVKMPQRKSVEVKPSQLIIGENLLRRNWRKMGFKALRALEAERRWPLFRNFVILCVSVFFIVIMLQVSQLVQQSQLHPRASIRIAMENSGIFGSELRQSSGSESEEKMMIPKRLHQMYKGESIPHVYVPYIKTWLAHHPHWEYWFWNDLDARRLIIDHYPEYLDMYDSYSNNLLRSDAARYFILHHHGGVYADMDMDCYRPIDPLVFNYTCIFSQEPYIQSQLLYDRSSIAMNAWMACAATHPFMNFVIEELPSFARPIKDISDTIDITGPVMLQETLVKYMKRMKCRYGQNCHVFIAPPDMFMPTWDQGQKNNFLEKCGLMKHLSEKQVLACLTLKEVEFQNHIPADVYGNHMFLHIGYKDGKFDDSESVHINTIVTNKPVHRYSSTKHGKKCFYY